MSQLQHSVHAQTPPQNLQGAPRNLAVALFATTIFALTAFGVFVLPFFFPPSHRTQSDAYAAGFNNPVADLSAACIACLSFLVAWRFSLFPHSSPQVDSRPTPRSVLVFCLASCAAFNAFFGWALTRANLAVTDSLYFLESMDNVLRYHLLPYSGFNFAYGPLLLFVPIWMHTLLTPFHVGTQGAYYLALTLIQCLGVLMLYATLQALQIPRNLRITAFILLTLTALNPVFGINYTLIRALLPFSTLLFAVRAKTPLTLTAFFFCGMLLQLSVSPEIGFAFAAGACFYAIARSSQSGPAWLVPVAALPAALGLFLAFYGVQYLAALFTFASGGFNLVVQPVSYILLPLLSLVWIVPRMLATDFRRHHPQALVRASLFVVALGLLPAALGRCDTLHVLYACLSIYVLAICALGALPWRVRNLWLACFAGVVLWTLFLNYYVRPNVKEACTMLFHHTPGQNSIDIARLRSITGNQPVSVPFKIPFNVLQQLKNNDLYRPDRDIFTINIADPAAESAKVHRLNRSAWALIPAHPNPYPDISAISPILRLLFGVGYSIYPVRHPPYITEKHIRNDLSEHWLQIATIGKWTLYHHNLVKN